MSKRAEKTYIATQDVAATISWLLAHQECYERFEYNALTQELMVEHANGRDIIKIGHYLNAQYGVLLTSG